MNPLAPDGCDRFNNRLHIATHPYFHPECECLVVMLWNTRKRVKGHHLVTIGTVDTVLVQIGMVFRAAIVSSASARWKVSAAGRMPIIAAPNRPFYSSRHGYCPTTR